MAKQPSITDLTSRYEYTVLNANLESLQEGFDNTLSLDGSLPNAMQADLDMNSNDILNVSVVNAATVKIGGLSISPSDSFISDRTDIKYEFKTVDQLLAFDNDGYFTVGDYIKAGDFSYLVVSSGEDATTAGGDKLTVVFQNKFPFDALGPAADGVTDDSAKLFTAIAAADGVEIILGPHSYLMSNLAGTTVANHVRLRGVKGLTRIIGAGGHGLTVAGVGYDVSVTGIIFEGYDRALRGLDDGNALGHVKIIDCESDSNVRAASFFKVDYFQVEDSKAYGPSDGSQTSQMGWFCEQPGRVRFVGNEGYWISA